ncbi:MAG: hypothetical protein E7299_00970 [Lachnospiraceae bacterium]|nr:hypothetical protein [Lachnospiraceae bacterium]
MAKERDPQVVAKTMEKKRLKEERKRLKLEQKAQKKEVRQRAKEISAQEAQLSEDEEPGGIPVFLVTVIIVLVWVAILCILIKLDVGGIGSGVLKPLLQNVPVVNKILPEEPIPSDNGIVKDEYSGYTSVKEAVDQIRRLERELADAQEKNLLHDDEVAELRAEIQRLQNFENDQLEFERIKTEFYEEVVYAENGPGAEEYQKYYESMDPATAEYLYKQVVQEEAASQLVKEYAEAYAAMKPKDAAAIFDTMTDDLNLVAKILGAMGTDDRGDILGQMDEANAARVTKIMDPEAN